MPNAIDLLKQDHDTVRDLLNELTDTTNGATTNRPKLLSRIKEELAIHTKLEEEIFYPAFKKANEKKNGPLFYEALEEHRIVEEMVIPDTEKADAGTDEFAGRAKVLKELVEHHAQDEEEEMFPAAREMLSNGELEELGNRMEARKKELQRK